MPRHRPNTQSRIDRFRAGVSLAEIAREDGVQAISIYHFLAKHGILTDTYLSDEFVSALRAAGCPEPEREYGFAHICPVSLVQRFLTPKTRKPRQWRADFAFPFHQLTVEVDGGKFVGKGGAHNSDREKRNAIAVCGWRTLRLLPVPVKSL